MSRRTENGEENHQINLPAFLVVGDTPQLTSNTKMVPHVFSSRLEVVCCFVEIEFIFVAKGGGKWLSKQDIPHRKNLMVI